MPDISFLLVFIIAAALFFDYTNGAHDAANAIAPVISTRVMSPKAAVIMSGLLNFAGAFLGSRVAATISKGIVDPQMIREFRSMILAAILGAIFWNLITWWFGLPSSSSHALVGGLIGAAVVKSGWGCLEYKSIVGKVILPLFLSPLLGFAAGYLIMVLLAWITRGFGYHRTNGAFKKLQVLTAAFMSMSHGSNDAQKTMGLISLSLYVFGVIPVLYVPIWVKIACAVAILLGTMTGGWKIIKTVGNKIFRMRPVHGFASQTASTAVIAAASWIGAPISTTHVISSSILGVGSARRISAVKWGVGARMVTAWVLTIPAAALVGAGCMLVLNLLRM